MSNNYNSILQSNNTDLQSILNIVNELPEAGGNPVLQDKTVTPTINEQTVTADSGYDGLDTVTVNAMPTATQATPSITVNASGLITATATQDAGYVIAGSKSATQQLAFQPAKTITPSTTSQIAVSSGYYTGGNVTVAAVPTQSKTVTPTSTTQNITPDSGKFLSKVTVNGDSDLIAGNIKSGVNIFGVTGTYVGSGGSGETVVDDVSKAIISRTITEINDDEIETIGNYAFYYCSTLTTASFPKATTIGSSAFAYCSTLTTASFPVATIISSGAFAYCSKLTTASFPAATIISNYAFAYCTSLTTTSFPKATTISTYAFAYCSKLTTASFPAAISIGSYAFTYCSKLTTASFPKATTIGNYAFYNCTSLTTASFPVATIISSGAFYYCSKLTTASFPKATTISSSAFNRCFHLKSLYLTGSNVCKLSNSNAFTSTPIGGYSTSAGTYGSIYVPASLLTSYQTATNWTYFSSRFVGV